MNVQVLSAAGRVATLIGSPAPYLLETEMVRFLILAAALGTGAVFADTTVPLTGDNTKITFVGTKKGGKHDGGFKKLTGTATFGADPTTLKIDIDIDMESIWTDTEKLTGHLKTPDFFDVKNNPKSKFTVTKVEKDKDGYKLTGTLDMHGKSKEISMPAKITQTGNSVKLESTFKINRFDWDVNYGKGKVDDNVEIKVKLDAKAK
jgi:polyisoprenoid-binding protein YceI